MATNPEHNAVAVDALWRAAWNDDVSTIEQLLNRGVAIDAIGTTETSALAAAIENSAVAATEVLLRHGASVEILDSIGEWMPLPKAVIDAVNEVTDRVKKHPDCRIIDLLIRYGADPLKSAPPLERSPAEYARSLCENADTREIGEALLKAFVLGMSS